MRLPVLSAAVAILRALAGCSVSASTIPGDAGGVLAAYSELDAALVEGVRGDAPDFTQDLDDGEVLAVIHNTCDELAIYDSEAVVDHLLYSGLELREVGTVTGAAVGAYCP